MRDIEIWRTSEKTIKKSQRYYAHFDYRTDISKSWEYISNPQNICKHGFYPFIHYVKDMSKYSAKKGGIKEKHRDIVMPHILIAVSSNCIILFLTSVIMKNALGSEYKMLLSPIGQI